MASSGGNASHSYAPSAPQLPESYSNPDSHRFNNYGASPPPSHSNYGQPLPPSSSNSYYGQPPPPPPSSSNSYYGRPPPSQAVPHQQQQGGSYAQSWFPSGTSPDVMSAFQAVDRDRSGFIDENELQQAISYGYQRFNLRTIRLLMFLFKNPNSSLRIGPAEFSALWSCLGHWRSIFERYDRDRSGKIDLTELKDALYSLGYAVPPSVLQLLISKYDVKSGRRVELNFDSFVECGMIVKGLTEKFKEKDTRYTGSATLTYDTFMTMVIPFLISYD